MGFAFGSLAVMSGYRPFEPSSLSRFSALFELRSMFLAVVVTLVLLVLAYLTNPTETSFRAFLTEQAFRHHLTRLDDSDAQDEFEFASRLDRTRPTMPVVRRGPSNFLKYCTTNAHSTQPFAFANRASISLRTPRHIFRSMGIVSVAAVVSPSGFHRSSTNRGQHVDDSATREDDEDCTSSASLDWDSWFMGAFGMWFWLGNLDIVWRGAGIIAKDEFDGDGTVSGVLEVKALDRSDEVNGLLTTPNGSSGHLGQRSAPKLRSRERFASQNGHSHSHRSQTPPPLPKSASLPLHTKRGAIIQTPERTPALNIQAHLSSSSAAVVSPSSSSALVVQTALPTAAETWQLNAVPSPSPSVSIPLQSSASGPSRSPSVLFAASPLIAEILRQLSTSQSSVDDLRTQLSEFQATSAAGRSALDEELEKHRERKRTDDAARTELKTQIKALEDQKRSAEGLRRDAEKRLRTACTDRDSVTARTERLEQEMRELRADIDAQGAKIVASGTETSELATELEKQVEEKRSELGTLEQEIATLSASVREVEEKVAFEEQRMERALVKAEDRRREMQNRLLAQEDSPSSTTFTNVNGGLWHATSPNPLQGRQHPADLVINSAFPPSPLDTPFPESPSSIGHHETQFGPQLPSPGLTIIPTSAKNVPIPGVYYPYKEVTSTDYVPFTESPHQTLFSPTGESLLPSSLCESLGVGHRSGAPLSPITSAGPELSRSFQSEDDAFLNRNWYDSRNKSAGDVGQLPYNVRTALLADDSTSANGSISEFDPFETRSSHHDRSSLSRLEGQRAALVQNNFLQMKDTSPTLTEATDVSPASSEVHTGRRLGWFGNKESKPREKKGLNPDAKEFSLSKDRERTISALLSRSRGNSSSGSSSTPSSASIHTPDSASLINSPASIPATVASSAVTVGTAPSALSKPHAATTGRTSASSLLGIGSSWFGTSRSAFAPTPMEQEQFGRVLSGPKNSSLPLVNNGNSASLNGILPNGQQSKPVLAHTQSSGLPSRSAWDEFGAMVRPAAAAVGSSFRPFEDEPRGTVPPPPLSSGSSISTEGGMRL